VTECELLPRGRCAWMIFSIFSAAADDGGGAGITNGGAAAAA